MKGSREGLEEVLGLKHLDSGDESMKREVSHRVHERKRMRGALRKRQKENSISRNKNCVL